jgi:hypothetical protein
LENVPDFSECVRNVKPLREKKGEGKMRKVNGTIVLMLLLSSLMLTLPVLQLTPNVQAQGLQRTLHSEKPLVPIHMHSLTGFIDPYHPLQTPFHELYPQFCQEFALTSWEDVNQTGHLNGGDQIDMINLTGGEVHWFYVDRVTYTLRVTNPQDPQSPGMYIEYKGTYDNETLRYDPRSSQWHEVYPVYGPLFHIKNYQDSQGTPPGLSFCDFVQFDDNVWWHIEEAATDLILNEKIADPTGTYWNELHPVFGNRYHITQWTDDGNLLLSPGDKVTLDPGQVGPSSVTQVTLTLNITLQGDPAQRMYLEFAGGYPHMWEPKTNPIGSMWHEVYPLYCPMYEIIDWVDNCNGVLSYCDYITLFDLAGQHLTTWHVEELAVDMVVQEPAPPVHDVAVISVTPSFGSVFQGWPDPITVDVQNQGDFFENFTVSVYYDTSPVTTSPKTVTNLAPKATQTLKFCWVTTNVPPDTYKITAYASVVPEETDTTDNTLPDGDVEVLAPPAFYWKAGFCDYAPSGMPDFDQKQWGTYNWTDKGHAWSHCGPTAAANSLWWLDSKFEPTQPPVSPPTPSDGFPLVSSYIPGIDDHDPGNVQPFIEHLAYLMDTDGKRTGLAHSGTNVIDMEAGLAQYLSWTGVNPKGDVNGDGIVNGTDVSIVNAAMGSTPISGNWNMAADIAPVTVGWPNRQPANNIVNAADLALVTANLGKTGFFYEHTVDKPAFDYIEQEVEKCQDVVLLVGYWYYSPTPPYWYREGGHYLTVAGVNSIEMKMAVSDPCLDAFENGLTPEGRVPIPHMHMPPEPPYITHNDAAYVSHDIYNVALVSQFVPQPNPNGTWTLVNYAGWKPTPPYFTVIESAVITSPLGIHDINVTDVTTSKDGCTPMPTVGQALTMRINVTVKNEGDFTESFTLTVNATNATTSIVVGTQTVSNLLSGETRMLLFTWDTTSAAYGDYTISAYATPVPTEFDTANNLFTDGVVRVVIPGDINADTYVNAKDAVLLGTAFNSNRGQPSYNRNADVNDDDYVNAKDAVLLGKHFNEHEP